MPGHKREHRTAVRTAGVLCAELIRVDRTWDRKRLILDHLDSASALETCDDARRLRVVCREGDGVVRGAESSVLRRWIVHRHRRAHDRCRDGDGDEGENQELLAPFPAEKAPGPTNDGTTGRDAAIGGASSSERFEDSGAHRGSFDRS